jgi:hypothetical protein
VARPTLKASVSVAESRCRSQISQPPFRSETTFNIVEKLAGTLLRKISHGLGPTLTSSTDMPVDVFPTFSFPEGI